MPASDLGSALDMGSIAAGGVLSRALPWFGKGGLALLSAGGAALIGASWPVWAGLAILASVPFLISAYNGIQEEFNTDLTDLESEIKNQLDDNTSDLEKRLLAEIITDIEKIRIDKAVLDAGGADHQVLGKSIASIGFLLKSLRSKINQLSSASGGIMPGIMAVFLSSTRDRMNNLEESWGEFMDTVAQQAKTIAAEEEANPTQSSQNSDLPYPGQEKENREPGPTDLGDASEKTKSGPATPEAEKARIEGVQQFLKTNFDTNVSVTGIMDEATRQALDNFAEQISVETGVGNLDGTVLENRATNQSMRRIYDIYKHPWKYHK